MLGLEHAMACSINLGNASPDLGVPFGGREHGDGLPGNFVRYVSAAPGKGRVNRNHLLTARIGDRQSDIGIGK